MVLISRCCFNFRCSIVSNRIESYRWSVDMNLEGYVLLCAISTLQSVGTNLEGNVCMCCRYSSPGATEVN
jgi:hypothetical protein